MVHKWIVISLLAATAILGFVGPGFPSGSTDARRGGTFRIALQVNSIDPALTDSPEEQMLMRATCAQLMAFPGPKPEIAAGYPKVSRNRLTYTFTIRKGFRFSSGEPVTARNFARGITRVLSPTMRSPNAPSIADHLLGARAFLEGRAGTVRGVAARGRTLVLKLAKPWPELPHVLASAGAFCPVPARLPIVSEGFGAPLPGSGPYYFARYVPDREVILARNGRYGGRRPRQVGRFVVDLTSTPATATQQVIAGKADLAIAAATEFDDLARRYGVNRTRFFTFSDPASTTPRLLILNTQRRLFRNNAKLRRAVSLAIDRRALIRAGGGPHLASPADQFLSPLAAAFRDARIYPPRGHIAKARALARGRTRSGTAVLYVVGHPLARAQAQLVRESLRQIGIAAEIREFPHPVFLGKLATRGEPFDLALSVGFASGYPNETVLNEIFHGRSLPPAGLNFSRFNSPRYNRLLDRAERLAGAARFRLYGRLDVELARDAVPAVPIAFEKGGVLISTRVGCHSFKRPLFDLAAVCLKR